MDIPVLGKLETVSIKEVWSHEAHSFTPWLLENYQELAQVVGIDIVLSHSEHAVGAYSLDLIGKDATNEDVVIIENQLEQSDHTHLGQILTYAAGTDAKNIIWVAPKFRDEHRAAIDWLNNRTDESTRFFAVAVSAVKIGDSVVAPRFELVAQPNDWGKSFKSQAQSENISEKSGSYQEFWGKFLETVKEQKPGWTNSKVPSKFNYMNLSSGTSAISYGLNFPSLQTGSGLKAELYLWDSQDDSKNKARFDYLADRKDEIEAAFGGPLNWEEMPNNKASRISIIHPNASVDEVSRWSDYIDWFITTTEKLKKVFGPYIPELSKF